MFFINDLESLDRYGLQKFLEYHPEHGGFSTLNSTFVTELKSLTLQSYITSEGERPDLVAYKIYGDTQFTWLIMLYNSCIDFTDGTFSTGSQIKYPALEDVERIIFTLKARDRAHQAELGNL